MQFLGFNMFNMKYYDSQISTPVTVSQVCAQQNKYVKVQYDKMGVILFVSFVIDNFDMADRPVSYF